MAASSSAESRSWVTSIHYETLELLETIKEHARVYKAKEQGTNKVFAVKKFEQAVGPGSKRYREAVKREGDMLLAVQGGVSTAIRKNVIRYFLHCARLSLPKPFQGIILLTL